MIELSGGPAVIVWDTVAATRGLAAGPVQRRKWRVDQDSACAGRTSPAPIHASARRRSFEDMVPLLAL